MIEIEDLKHNYRTKQALRGLSLSVKKGEIFGFLGPNGCGKTTLFRILATTFAPASGTVRVGALDVATQFTKLRQKIGVVFQSPSLDDRLSVLENLKAHGFLYGLHGNKLKGRMEAMLRRLGLADRAKDKVSSLSGGMKRRVELAKGLLHRPEILILDEPCTGLDPGARVDLWKYLKSLRDQDKVTVLVTTHLMEEAEYCDRIAIMNEGEIVKVGRPQSLKEEVGKDVVIVRSGQEKDLPELEMKIRTQFGVNTILSDGSLQIEHGDGANFVTDLVETFPGQIESVTYRKPTLEDAFIHFTGHRFWSENAEAAYV